MEPRLPDPLAPPAHRGPTAYRDLSWDTWWNVERRVRGDGDGWVVCDAGHRHWGRFGAAGLLLRHGSTGGHCDLVLLAHRVWWSHHGGTWGIPGGARNSGETAREAALREAVEETGVDPARVRLTGATTDDHGGWSYVTVHARLETAEPPALEPTDGEATELRWTPVDDVAGLALHPGFAAFWGETQRSGEHADRGARPD